MEYKYTKLRLFKRLYWDLLLKDERKYYYYEFLSRIPGIFGTMLRSNFVRKHAKKTGGNLKVYSDARFRSIENLSVGDNVELGIECFIQSLGGVTLGDNVMLAPGVRIWSTNHNVHKKEVLIQNQKQSESEVIIGDDVFIGLNSIVLPGVNLPVGTVVTAGSVVGVKAYKPYSIISGNPARVIGYRE